MRLDLATAEAFGISRQRAKELILDGLVRVNDKRIYKPSFEVLDSKITLLEHRNFLSRGAAKLYNFLESAGLKDVFSGKKVLDVGSSKGGFASIALEFGASSVVCVDVGSNQFDKNLLFNNKNKIALFENTDIRNFKSDKNFEIITCDVSFISLKKIFAILCAFGDEMILLFKPQFEVGKLHRRNSKGVLLEGAEQSALEFSNYLTKAGFKIQSYAEANPKGKEGNVEFFFHIKRL